jgi:glycerol uptake facilitator protein
MAEQTAIPEPTWGRKYLAELVGTYMLVLVGPGAAMMSLLLNEGTSRATEFNIGIGALGGMGEWLAIGLAFGLIVAVAIYAFGHISGCHINPAVTIALASVGRFPWSQVVQYIIAQFVGAALASFTLVGMLGTRAATVGGLGAPGPFPGVGPFQVLLAEFLGTFILMYVIMGVAVDRRAPAGWAGWIIGMTVAAVIITMGNISGQGINPARTFGPYLGNTIFGGSNLWYIYWAYLIGPIAGAVVAAFLYVYISRIGLRAE